MRAIVYQQLAGKAAATIYGRVQALYGGRPPTPAELAATSAARLRRAGLSRQKLGYLKDLARRVASGRLALDALDGLPDEAVIEALTVIRGVGVWTAQMFLMFRLGRLDVLPVLDLGIQKGMRRTYALRRMPKPAEMERIAAGWSPYRSVACWYLWRAAELPDPTPRRAPGAPAREKVGRYHAPMIEAFARTDRHTTFYLADGPESGTPIVFVHGWPELSLSWRHQLPCFGALGFRAVAPDMRGYGRSTVHPRHEDYAVEHAVRDMLDLLDALGRDRAIWVGHDWGSPVVWSLASHHPDRCHGVANLCVPYFAQGFAPATLVPLVDRSVYPEAEYPVGQWDYQLFYEESFDRARAAFEADVRGTVKALFRKRQSRAARGSRRGPRGCGGTAAGSAGPGARPRCRSTRSCSPRRISSATRARSSPTASSGPTPGT